MDTEGNAIRAQHDAPTDVVPVLDVAEQAAMWDERYSDADRVWSGEPNGALVAEVAALTPGTVLDVGCGEGADAVWLAQQGWDVTALDVSEIALDRGRRAAVEAGVDVRWLLSDLLGADLPHEGFDLVSAQYPAILRSPDQDAERALLSFVAPGGTLLFVHHSTFGSPSPGEDPADDTDPSVHGAAEGATDHHHGAEKRQVDPRHYVGPVDIVAALGDDWQIEIHETRDRTVTGGAGAHHHEDVVVRARRRT